MIKKIISNLALNLLIGGTFFIACQSSREKEEESKDKVQEAKHELKEAKQDANANAQKVASAEEWKIFKNETAQKIKDNEDRIVELKIKMRKPGKIFDPLYENKIEKLQQKNMDLKARIDAYEKSQSDWESFKREFNHDMDELGNALYDLTLDNKK